MKRQLDAGAGRKVFKDYITALHRYFIPFFGRTFITSIDHDRIQAFNAWRVTVIGHEPKGSTLNTHNSAMNRVYAEAVSRGFVMQAKVPILANNGEGARRRPDFSLADYRTMIRKVQHLLIRAKGASHAICESCCATMCVLALSATMLLFLQRYRTLWFCVEAISRKVWAYSRIWPGAS